MIKLLKELCGNDEYNKAKDEFVEFFESQDIVGETLAEWLQLQNLESRVNYITTHAKKERRQIFDISTFERVKKGKIYEAGTV